MYEDIHDLVIHGLRVIAAALFICAVLNFIYGSKFIAVSTGAVGLCVVHSLSNCRKRSRHERLSEGRKDKVLHLHIDESELQLYSVKRNGGVVKSLVFSVDDDGINVTKTRLGGDCIENDEDAVALIEGKEL